MKVLTWEKSLTSTELALHIKAAISLFWNLKMAAVTSCENSLYLLKYTAELLRIFALSYIEASKTQYLIPCKQKNKQNN